MKKILTLTIFILFIFLASCSNSGYKVISPTDAYNMRENDSSVKFVDVREPSEYEAGHIQAAILLPLSTLEEDVDSVLTNKDGFYIVYCHSGNRSSQAAKILVQLGYTNIYDMGGILDWPYETVS